ncbi:MAG: FeS-binding protein [Methylophaga sp.]|nr:MAG: FeS-binding protein [Methylophaga sp.]
MTSYFLCRANELKDEQSRSFSLDTAQGVFEVFLHKTQQQIKAFQNHCPHLGIPLNWQPNEFLSIEGTHFQCSTHGALFNIDDGLCIAGPCTGQSLTPLELIQKEDGGLWIKH